MGTAVRTERISVKDELFQYPKQFSFDMAVYILDCRTSVSFGKEVSVTKASFKTVSVIALHLRATEIEDIAPGKENFYKPTIYVSRLALAGLNAPLPTPYAALAIRRYHDGDRAISSFLNIFNARLLGISYRVSQRRYLVLQRKNQWPMLKCIANFLGEQSVPKQMTRLAYLFWTRGHTVEGLKILIESYFRLKVTIHTVSEHWEPLREVIPLGINTLGQNAYLGQKASLKRFCLRVCITHDDSAVIFNLLSDKHLFSQLKSLIRKYIGPIMICKLEITPPNTPPLKFFTSLGKNSWLQGTNADFLRVMV